MIFFSCKRATNYIPSTDNNVQTVKADLFGQIIDESGIPIIGAIVKTSTHTFITDSNGVFQFVGIQTSKERTVLEVSKENYFKGYRTMYIVPNEDNFTRIILVEKKNPANFNAASGGTINVNGGGSITFKANSIVNKNTGVPYNGNVTVYSTWIDPTSSKLGDLIPGALRGFNTNGEEKLLQSYGMVGAELFDDTKQALQIASGYTAQITFPIPGPLATTAPANIPLWYFDETNGMWKEQGNAQVQGGNYVGNVSHFSFWNCDYPATLVQLEAIVKNTNGTPIANAKVRITNTANSTTAYDYTNSSGKVKGAVPQNANLKMEIFVDDCNILLYSQNFNTTTTPCFLNDITVAIPPSNQANISGTILNCTNSIVKNGYLTIKINNDTKILKASSNGNFACSMIVCNVPLTAGITAYDADKNVFGATNNFAIISGNNNIGNLSACGNTFSQFIEWHYTINGILTNFTVTDALGYCDGGYNGGSLLNVVGGGDTITQHCAISLAFYGQPSLSGNHYLKIFSDHLDTDLNVDTTYSYLNSIIPVSLTKYDIVGGLIEGSFEGTVLGLNIPSRYVYCNFKVIRTN